MNAFVIHSTSTAYIIAQPRRVKLFVGDGTAHGIPWLHVKAPGLRMFAPSLTQARGSRRVPNCCVGRVLPWTLVGIRWGLLCQTTVRQLNLVPHNSQVWEQGALVHTRIPSFWATLGFLAASPFSARLEELHSWGTHSQEPPWGPGPTSAGRNSQAFCLHPPGLTISGFSLLALHPNTSPAPPSVPSCRPSFPPL